MQFGLKNARATFQCLVDNALQKQIGWNLKVYVDDIVIKSRTEKEIIRDMEETFRTIQEINMKLNPKKYTFRIREGMFLGYKVYADGLKVCPDIVDAVLSLPSPKSLKDVQRLGSQLYTNEEIGIGPSKCQQAAKEILPCTYNYHDNKSADKADTVKSRDFIVERPEEESSDVPWKKKENSQNHGFCLLMDLHVLIVSELDSRLVANQVNGSYIVKELGMIQYLEKVRMLTQSFKGFLIKQGPRGENKKADTLSKIASTSFAHLSKELRVEELKEKQINEKEMLVIVEEEGCTWMILVHRPVPRNPHQNLTPITSPWPFYKWGIDIAGPFLEGPGKEANSKAKMEKYYSSKVRDTSFKPADLVYLNNDASDTEDGGKLGPKLEGPYKVTEALGKGAYRLRNRKGNILPRTWNICNLKKCYVH
ncbi:reverse transcriptase domain-containing protein [Tanacetum coccineum]|uniref:Reverse transcriptase domain-containing protein n=1 Tax=Tanacetum coccineum TaxID=301880 RepID=A0ABQ5CKM7_9ASTR